MKGNKKLCIIGILLIFILIISLIFLKLNKQDYTKIKEVNSFSVENLVIEKTYRWCTVQFDLVRQNLKDQNLKYYDAYFLDSDNNLLYIQPLENFASFYDENPATHISYELNYDVSDTKYIKVIFKGSTYKYNEDKRKSLQELPLDEDLNDETDA